MKSTSKFILASFLFHFTLFGMVVALSGGSLSEIWNVVKGKVTGEPVEEAGLDELESGMESELPTLDNIKDQKLNRTRAKKKDAPVRKNSAAKKKIKPSKKIQAKKAKTSVKKEKKAPVVSQKEKNPPSQTAEKAQTGQPPAQEEPDLLSDSQEMKETVKKPASETAQNQQAQAIEPSPPNPEKGLEPSPEEQPSETAQADQELPLESSSPKKEPSPPQVVVLNEDQAKNRELEEIQTDPQALKELMAKNQKDSPESAKNAKNYSVLSPAPGNNPPQYPEKARDQGQQGSVLLLYFVDNDGLVDKIQMVESSGHSLLDNEALRTMARHRYLPGQSGWYKHKVHFRIQ